MEEKDFDEINSLAEYLNSKDDFFDTPQPADEPQEISEEAPEQSSEAADSEQANEEAPAEEVVSVDPTEDLFSDKEDENRDATRMIDSIKNTDFSSDYEEDENEPLFTPGASSGPKSEDIAKHFGKNSIREENDVPVERPKKAAAKKKKKVAERKERLRKERKRYERRRTFAHIFGGILLSVLIISLSAFFAFYIVQSALDFTGIAQNEFEVELEIPDNATTDEVAEILAENGIIKLPKLFEIYSK
ncbi:MAG: hypothetical protein ACI4J1_02590, partial [Ruminiclostridium sp.]